VSRSQNVRQKDVRALLRIMGELHELPRDGETQGEHLMTRICELVGGKLALVGVMRAGEDGNGPQLLRCVVGGSFDDQVRSALALYVDGMYAADPSPGLIQDIADQTVVRARQELIADRDWYRHPHVAEARRAADIDGYLAAVYPLGEPGLFGSFAVSRTWKDRRFGARERTLLGLLNAELGWFYRRLRPVRDDTPLATLAPQVRRTLELLLTGVSEKEAARELGLSRHTVHDYVKVLYRRFEVSSRAELMARCLPLVNGGEVTERRRDGET
jgi:DNA-binding CsgD family transcriptional regulator